MIKKFLMSNSSGLFWSLLMICSRAIRAFQVVFYKPSIFQTWKKNFFSWLKVGFDLFSFFSLQNLDNVNILGVVMPLKSGLEAALYISTITGIY